MKVVKRLIRKDDATDFASHVFDKVLLGLDIPMHSESVEFTVRDMTAASLHGETAHVCLDYDNVFLKEGDERALKTLLARQMYKIFLLERGRFSELNVNKEMIRNGHYDDLFYLYYNLISKTAHPTKEEAEFLSVSLSTFDNKDDNMFLRNALDNVIPCR